MRSFFVFSVMFLLIAPVSSFLLPSLALAKSASGAWIGNRGGGWTNQAKPSLLTATTLDQVLEDNSPSSSTTTTTTTTTPSSTTSNSQTTIVEEEFIKPDPDEREYRWIQLSNGLQVLLVSAPESDVEAAAVHVQAGHMDDPDDRPGLAHFHEHMLFLGTTKYPNENEYEAFLSKFGGSSNAYTDMEDTNYYFSVLSSSDDDEERTSEGLSGALDRLAQFFIAPVFESSMVERELRAVDSEYRNSFTSDSWRYYQMLKGCANPKHPFAKFGCGNYKTLSNGGDVVNATYSEGGTSPRPDLLQFWNKFYKTYNLRLSVVGRASLDDLQQTIEETFGQLPPSQGAARHQNENPESSGGMFRRENAQYGNNAAFGPAELGRLIETIPFLESRTIKLSFATPPLDDPILKDSRPYRVVSHLLGHEAPGSLHALLNDKGYLTDLSSGVGVDTSDFSLFTLTMSLTPKGMKEREAVLDLVFQWIAMIRKVAIEDPAKMKLYHDELRSISDVNFQYRENGDPVDFVSAAAELMFNTEPSLILVGSSQTGEYDPVVAEEFLNRLRPENCLITVVNSDLDDSTEDWKQEPWYGAKYRVQELSPEQMKEWESPVQFEHFLHLPALNNYIPTDFSLRCDDHGHKEVSEEDELDPPSLIIDRPDLRLWHKMDRYWRVPKTNIKLSILSPDIYRSPRTMTLNRIYQRVLNDDLNSFVYDASVAGCTYRVACTPSSFRLSLRGYSEKLPFLLDVLTSRMFSLIDEMKEGKLVHPALAEKFEKAKDNLLRETKNYRLDTPYEIASYNSRLIFEENAWYVDDYISEMEGSFADKLPLTMEECARVAQECLQGRLKVESLCFGNIDEKGAANVAEVIESHFLGIARPLSESELPSFRALKLPTRQEAQAIFGPKVASKPIPLVYQELALSESEDTNAMEMILQVGSEWELGYEGIAVFELIAHMAYTSAFNQLRTKEQLGYIVNAFGRRVTGGAWGLSVVVQSSIAVPEQLEERTEEWLKLFQNELKEMTPEQIADEASAVVAQLLERDTKLSQEVSRAWDEISMTEGLPSPLRIPVFDRLERLADELTLEGSPSLTPGKPRKTAEVLKKQILDIFDKHLVTDSPQRRVMSSRLYNQKAKASYERNLGEPGVLSSYKDIQCLKQYLTSWPPAPYGITPVFDHEEK